MRKLLEKMDGCGASGNQFGKRADPQCLRDVANEYVGEANPRARDFVTALQELARYLGGLRGHKSVLVLGHGIPVDPNPVLVGAAMAVFGNPGVIADLQRYVGFGSSPRAEMDRLLELLVQNRVSVSFVDRHLPPTGDFQASRGALPAAGMSPMRVEHDAAVADMEQIATASGGIHVRMSDLGAGLGRAIDVLDGGYELGIEVDEYVDAKLLSKIHVACTRRGVKLGYSRGVPVSSPRVEPSLAGRIVLTKGMPVTGERKGAIHQAFRLEVDPKAIGYEVRGEEAESSFTVHLALLSPSQGPLADTFHFVNHAYEASLWNAGGVGPMTLTGWIEAPPGEYLFRAWVRNVTTGKEGVVGGPIRVSSP
jgi:hypothetical protein